ncbi:hypothetical protein GOBAR_AA15815 [Gossypium barbadense]|uniref:DNA 3'-5' helicase n=1 Tax=Gossypium barbadense TaxID=3634 RepID=A0A2P5XNB8_GOSBA|nr:hypothetical protein GOBAR_AA15815 [Gossypium barbadense]
MDSYSLKSVFDLPESFRSIFNFRYFNSLQSECFPVCFLSDVNMIYIAPSKALVQEKLRDWTQKFGSLGISCLELTGDNDSYSTRNIQEADIILTTPEKFDAVTRYRIKDGGLSFFSDISLLLIDEVHLLNDLRGATLEAIVSRIKMLARNPEMKSSALASVRFLAVSATIPNTEDLAEWLEVPVQGIKRFGEEMRPVKLTTKVFILMQYSRGKSALVFCSTRSGAQEAAQRLSQIVMTFGYSNPFIKSREQQERLREASLSCSDKQMQSYILYGVGYHNGGLSLKDRNLIEGLFLNGDVQVLCTTNTLAHGINLPAHTVVIKSTQHFNKEKGLYMEYDRSMILQMCGRAGRPPFEDTGMVIIMTRRETNPGNYAVKKGIRREQVEKHMQEICVQNVNELSCHQMIQTDQDGFALKPQEPGRLMTKYYLKFNTMKHIMQAPSSCSLEEVLQIICHAEEIAWIQLRRNEKKILNDINGDKDGRLRFHVTGDKGKRKKRIQTREEKIFVLANDCLTGDPLVPDLSMTQDANSICSNGARIAKCMKEYFIYKKNYRGALNSSLLAKSLYQKLWDDSPYLLKQLPGIGMVTAKALHSMGIKSFETLAEADPRRIELVTGRKFPFGNHIKESLTSLPPKVDIKIEVSECLRQGKSKLAVTLTRLSSQGVQSTKRHYADMIVASEEENLILFHEKISFIHAVGVDLHEKLLLVKESNSNANLKRARKPTQFFAPEEVYVIEDDKAATHKSFAQRPPDLIESKRKPSFNLLDEELEGEFAAGIENDDCKIITEQSIFDHIREKAKNFPLLTPNNAYSPSSDQEKSKIRQHILLGPLPESKGLEQIADDHNNYLTGKHHITAGSSVTINLTDESGYLPSEPEAFSFKSLTEEAIFDHIRKKSKHFPVINMPKPIDTDCCICTEEHNSVNQPGSGNATLGTSKDAMVISEPEPGEVNRDACGTRAGTKTKNNVLQGSSSGANGESAVSPKVSSTKTATLSVQMLSFDISMAKNSKHLADLGSSIQDGRKDKPSPSDSKRQSRSLASTDQAREVGSFLGFQSVFSFL